MSASPDALTLARWIALPLYVAVALALAWAGSLVMRMAAQRAEAADPRLSRSWLVTGTLVGGCCAWAAALAAAAAWGAPAGVPFGAAAVTLPLALAAAGASLLCVASLRRAGRLLGATARAVSAIAGLALALALPLAILVAALPAPGAARPGFELLCAALAAAMALLAVEAARMERRLAGHHQVLGAQLKRATAHLQRGPLADALTGLLSRQGLEGVLRKAAGEAEPQGQRVALFAIGLDGFRSINDSFGHALGDSVLREVARRLARATAACHEPPKVVGHHIARLGGDEFMLMLQGQLDRATIGRVAGRLLEALDGPLTDDQHEIQLSASIGVASFPEDGGASTLVSRANAAMHAAKEAGGSTYTTFEPRMQEDARDRHDLLRDLRHAIDNHQLELYYQPKIDARSGQVTAAEALLRWHHPVRGTLDPDAFVPLAERHGLIAALGNWVIDDACRQARVWRERGLKMRVAINLSVFQMRQNDLVERIQAALKRHGVNPQRLTCEITESVAMEDTQVTQRTFERLGQAGIHLSIDDFGTGYSSLSYLRRLPATELKIDRSFIQDLETSPDARAIVDAVLKLAHAIGLKVVAEGVENARQRDILLGLGCDEFQGYLFARPMSARALMRWAVDDKPAKNAFRASLFGETDVPTVQGALPAPAATSVVPLRPRRRG